MEILECAVNQTINPFYNGINCILQTNNTISYECFKNGQTDYNVFQCYSENSIFTGFLSFIPLMHEFIIPFSFFYSLYDKKVFSVTMTLWYIIFNQIIKGMQFIFQIERPYPECISSFFSRYSFPNKEVILVSSNIIAILYYTLIIQKGIFGFCKRERRYGHDDIGTFKKLKRRVFCCGEWLIKMYGFFIIILLCILHQLSIYYLRLSSGPHILLSLVFGGFFNLMVCICVSYIIKYMYENGNGNNGNKESYV